MRRTVALALGLSCALSGLLLPGTAPASRAAVEDPVRILIVGDSVTQGSAGDWTWRYRLWTHFEAAGTSVDFVGPREDLYDNLTGEPGSMAYADPDFDRDHAARWGMQIDVPDVAIGTLVEEYSPDVVVEMLGVNDILFGRRSPQVVVDRVRRFVDEARAADPSVGLVLAEATQTWWQDVPEFNELLGNLAGSSSTEDSEVALARAAAGYDAGPHTWDDSHPNARGEAMIAAAVADALHEIGIGPAAVRPVLGPPVGPRVPAVVTGLPGAGSVTLRWSGPPGATAHYVWGRDATSGEPWRRMPWPVTGASWTAYLLTDGHRYQFRLQPKKGDDEPEGRVLSDVVTVIPGGPAGAVRRLRVARSGARATLAWKAATRATRYEVQMRRRWGWDTVGSTTRSGYVVRGLSPARGWRFRVRSWNADLVGGVATVRLPRR
jgi:lysophospholipase L1-like esterase